MKKAKRSKQTWLKILSVVLAILLWIYVVNEGQNPTRHNVKEVNLRYYNLGEGLTAEGPDTVKVKIWGSTEEQEEVEAYVDLNGLGEGLHEVPVKVQTLKGALLTAVEPKEVRVRIRKINEHVFKIKLQTTGALPSGYELFGLEISPKTCLIKGDESLLRRVASVLCEVNLNEINGTKVFEVPLMAIDSNGRKVREELTLLPQKATVYAAVGNKVASREVSVNPILEGNPEAGYEIKSVAVIPDKITLIGDPYFLENLQKVNTLPVRVEGQSVSGSYKAKLVLPDAVKGYPDEVLVNIEIKKKENE
ncbi:CdaR family protein [Thermosyntropha sp.]|uniref:CdaR family protein n=1 Tax=Thermosyntropha sp. TaxID=2740820 RepID=UPI0025FF6F0D|nr:CdaR family protein [Thermosyntropha sp.]MBO8158146.1 hypothetical protein [Thermosyntropha sp.]